MKLLYLFMALLVSSNLSAQYSYGPIFTERQADSINRKIDSLLIIVSGTTVSRIFLEDMSDHIVKKLGKENITATYVYSGKSSDRNKSIIDSINKDNYKTVLFLSPKSNVTMEVEGNINESSIGTPFGNIKPKTASSGIDFNQSFSFHLFRADKNMEEFWIAIAELTCDPGKPRCSKIMGDKILSYFKKNNYTN
jgi:hypothetical protein